ncbi:MAG: hypothetical protein WKF43_17350 [Acidimicrobiales bacterium]
MVPSRSSPTERHSYWLAALVLLGVMVALVTATIVLAPSPSSDSKTQERGAGDTGRDIIPRPNQGQAPQDPGDRGGWEQLAILAAIVVGIGLLATLAWRSGHRARDRRGTQSRT